MECLYESSISISVRNANNNEQLHAECNSRSLLETPATKALFKQDICNIDDLYVQDKRNQDTTSATFSVGPTYV